MRRGRLSGFHSQRGMTLSELMVVVAILGILSALAVPRYANFKARAKQTEARSGLSALFASMISYQAAYSTFPVFPTPVDPVASGARIGFALNGSSPAYGYLLISNGSGWGAVANSRTQLANGRIDSLRMSGNRWLCSAYDAVTELAANPVPTARFGSASLDCPQKAAGVGLAPRLTVADFPAI